MAQLVVQPPPSRLASPHFRCFIASFLANDHDRARSWPRGSCHRFPLPSFRSRTLFLYSWLRSLLPSPRPRPSPSPTRSPRRPPPVDNDPGNQRTAIIAQSFLLSITKQGSAARGAQTQRARRAAVAGPSYSFILPLIHVFLHSRTQCFSPLMIDLAAP